ncbi:L-aminopeptidase/D-esterase [Erythrobacter litoralis]|uniref:DmpA family aminopeptidase n=1 Tax=Erythrobacter litoralis TaxID=39960 RepID=UPI0008639B6F|nr:P1 family peptidase [Erythrobacter litoralis]AOL22878.1 L-aminopeptidase/D-esterase [Erythrobacter litoralis]
MIKGRSAFGALLLLGMIVPAFGLMAETDSPPVHSVRARDLGVPFGGTPGPLNAITDVAGVEVGHTTLISGEGELLIGKGPVRTGVTAVLPRGKTFDPVYAGWFSLNGNGEMTGTTWIEESGWLEGPVMLTNTHSVGTVRDATIDWARRNGYYRALTGEPDVFWMLPVVAETYDGDLNDINGFHVTREHVFAALDQARSGPVTEGNVGGGTGMITHGFKGGIGTSSRIVTLQEGRYSIGVLVQSNYGVRETFTVAGVPVGREIADLGIEYAVRSEDTGSIIIVIATDAPLLPHQLKRLARRASMGIARNGSFAGNGSGDIFIAFSTANPGAWSREGTANVASLPNDSMSPLFLATIEATEEAVINAMIAARTMTGINGNRVHALPHGRLQEALRKYRRLDER